MIFVDFIKELEQLNINASKEMENKFEIYLEMSNILSTFAIS